MFDAATAALFTPNVTPFTTTASLSTPPVLGKNTSIATAMSSFAARSALRAAPRLRAPIQRRFASDAANLDRQASKDALKTGAKRDPELYILLAIMSGAFGLAGWHFSRNPTSASSERSVAKAPDSEPWKEGGASGKYQYHPGGDPNAPKKDAPSALNVVILPNVTLPKELHDQYNKWGKDGY